MSWLSPTLQLADSPGLPTWCMQRADRVGPTRPGVVASKGRCRRVELSRWGGSRSGEDVFCFEGIAEMDPFLPPTSANPAYQAKYGARI
ncbi:MAG: hypothetical protein LH650_15840, partial [Chloroflexi bacterium]|nr:hypothetical protein [Chloroflexota bacterium]